MTLTDAPPPAHLPSEPRRGGAGLGLAALIVGVVAVVAAVVPFLSYGAWLLGIVAVVLGIVGAVKATKKGTSITGIVLGAVAVVLSIALSIVYTAMFFVAAASDAVASLDTKATAAPLDDSDGSGSGSDAGASSDTAVFGQTFTYEDGLSITVKDAGAFTPSQYAAAEKADHYEKFTIVIKNGTDETFDPAIIRTSLQDGDAEADEVYDSEKGYGGGPRTKVLPGRSVKWKVGFGVNSDDLVMQVAPDFTHDDAIFTSK